VLDGSSRPANLWSKASEANLQSGASSSDLKGQFLFLNRERASSQVILIWRFGLVVWKSGKSELSAK
jgi:hypothetical protein